MTTSDDSHPFDPTYDGAPLDPEEIFRWFGYSGWDTHRRDRWDNCDGNLEEFADAMQDLRAALEAGRLVVQCDADLVALQQSRQRWWPYVDPALSDSSSQGDRRGPFITLWECSEHVFALCQNAKGKWVIYGGSQEEVTDLRFSLGVPDEEEYPDEENIQAPPGLLREDLTEEDHDLMRLLPAGERERLEGEQLDANEHDQ